MKHSLFSILLSGLGATLLSAGLFAAEAPIKPVESGEAIPLEDELSGPVVIKKSEAYMVEEYRVGGQRYMLKIVPRKGRPYYLIDTDGDGVLERRVSELSPSMVVPSWEILRW